MSKKKQQEYSIKIESPIRPIYEQMSGGQLVGHIQEGSDMATINISDLTIKVTEGDRTLLYDLQGVTITGNVAGLQIIG